jgi:hypothetical protein
MTTVASRSTTPNSWEYVIVRKNTTSLALAILSVALWAVSLPQIRLDAMTDAGLVSVLPSTFWASFVLLIFAFLLALKATRRSVLLLSAILALELVFLYGTSSFVEHGPRTQTAWKLAGIVDYITRHGSVDGNIDAFFNWPAFFILQAFVLKIAGLSSSLTLANRASLFFNLAYLFPLAVFFRALAIDTRHVVVPDIHPLRWRQRKQPDQPSLQRRRHQPLRVDDRDRPANATQRQGLVLRRDGAALDRAGMLEAEQQFRRINGLPRPRQTRHRDRARHPSPSHRCRPHPDPRGRYRRSRLTDHTGTAVTETPRRAGHPPGGDWIAST